MGEGTHALADVQSTALCLINVSIRVKVVRFTHAYSVRACVQLFKPSTYISSTSRTSGL